MAKKKTKSKWKPLAERPKQIKSEEMKRVGNEMGELLMRDEPLRKELHRYVTANGPLLHFQHPLCVMDILNGLDHCALVHQHLDHKQAAFDQAKKDGRWRAALCCFEKEFLLDGFCELAEEFSDTDYWEMLAHVWTHQEELWPNRELFLTLFSSPRSQREMLMRPEERNALTALPNQLTIHRGYAGTRKMCLSWTTDRAKAQWFADRFAKSLGDKTTVATGTVKKSDVLAYFIRRNESEVLVDPSKITF